MVTTIEKTTAEVISKPVPWQSLGNSIKSSGQKISISDILEAGDLNWQVVKDNLRTKTRNIPVPGKVALVRETDGAFFDIVGSNWQPIQNTTAAEFYQKFCEKGKLKMHTAGSLDGGRIVWFLAQMNSGFTLPGGDEIEGHLLFMNPHSFARSAVVEFTPIREVSNTTLILALQKATKSMGMKVAVSHKTKFDPSIVERALSLSEDRMHSYEEAARLLAKKKAKVKDVEIFFNTLFPVIRYNTNKPAKGPSVEDLIQQGKKGSRMRSASKNSDRLFELLEVQPGHDMSPGTWWQALNAIMYLVDHEFGRTVDSRLKSSWTGANRRLKLRALNLALEMAGAA